MRFTSTLLLCLLAPAAALAATTPPPPAGCATKESRQFDFWVGTWDVHPKATPQKKVATSVIENLYHGCAIRENWMPLIDHPGGSINAWSPQKKVWRQFWADSDGGSVLFEGGWNGKAMVLTGVWPQPGDPTQMTRMTYAPLADGSVEQSGVTSDDNGKTWQPSFDLIYVRARK